MRRPPPGARLGAAAVALAALGCRSPSIELPSADATVPWSGGTDTAEADGDPWVDDTTGGQAGAGGTAKTDERTGDAQARATRYTEHAQGYPADGRVPPRWCPDSPRAEHCSNRIDDDCDSYVDEFVADECPAQCADGQAHLACDTGAGTLVCLTDDYCQCAWPQDLVGCGDGVLGFGETCDPAAEGEQLGRTCTADCQRPFFVWCAENDGGHACLNGTRCNLWVGACLPVIGDFFPRCPELPVEAMAQLDPDPACQDGATVQERREFYPMVEVDEECRISCSGDDQCPSSLPSCYMGFCVVG